LIDRKIYKHVLIAPVAISGTYLEEWHPRGGKYFEVLLSAIAGLRDFNLETTAVLWHSPPGPNQRWSKAEGGAGGEGMRLRSCVDSDVD
jgi:hypothetical protein